MTFFLQGFYVGSGLMNPAKDAFYNPKWGALITDTFSIELHAATDYSTIVYAAHSIPLNTNGTASTIIPAVFNGSYYLTVKHRNSLETTSSDPVSFATTTVNYNFSDNIHKSFGDNQKDLSSGVLWGIYSGDITQAGMNYPTPSPVKDGVVDLDDVYYILGSNLSGDYGYLLQDLNGDGMIDLNDIYLAFDNYLLGVYRITP
jgi:hypothetical protein